MDQQAEKDKTERVTGLGRTTREEIAKWNQMTAQRFQTGRRHQTSPASLRGNQSRLDYILALSIAIRFLEEHTFKPKQSGLYSRFVTRFLGELYSRFVY